MGGLTLGSRTDRRRWFWIGLVMVALAAMAVVVPGASPAHSAKIKNIQYTFVFANSTEDGPGEVVTGLATSNNTTVILADKTELNMHVSCSDRYHLYDTNNNALAKDGRIRIGVGGRRTIPWRVSPDMFGYSISIFAKTTGATAVHRLCWGVLRLILRRRLISRRWLERGWCFSRSR